jgi:hypothetical protein
LCSISAPIPGAATGGYLADKNVKKFCNDSNFNREAIRAKMY